MDKRKAPDYRRNAPRQFLDPAIMSLEHALLYRVAEIEKRADTLAPQDAIVLICFAAEFRALAEELHYW